MRVRSIRQAATAHPHAERPLPPGTGILIAGSVSLLMWALIAGIATLV